MATLATIRDYVREASLLETDDWGNDKLLAVINEGIYEMGSRFDWPFLAATENIDTVATQDAYVLDTITDADVSGNHVARILAIVDLNKRVRLTEVAASTALAAYGGDFPDGEDATYFYLWSESIYLVPTPSETESDVYRMYYYKRPTILANDSDEPEWADQFHMALAYYTLGEVWRREEDFEKADAWDRKFDRKVEDAARYYLNRANDEPLVLGVNRAELTQRQLSSIHMPFLDGA